MAQSTLKYELNGNQLSIFITKVSEFVFTGIWSFCSENRKSIGIFESHRAQYSLNTYINKRGLNH